MSTNRIIQQIIENPPRHLIDPLNYRLTLIPVKPTKDSKLQPIEKGTLIKWIQAGGKKHPVNPKLDLTAERLKNYSIDKKYLLDRLSYLQSNNITLEQYLNYCRVSCAEYQRLIMGTAKIENVRLKKFLILSFILAVPFMFYFSFQKVVDLSGIFGSELASLLDEEYPFNEVRFNELAKSIQSSIIHYQGRIFNMTYSNFCDDPSMRFYTGFRPDYLVFHHQIDLNPVFNLPSGTLGELTKNIYAARHFMNSSYGPACLCSLFSYLVMFNITENQGEITDWFIILYLLGLGLLAKAIQYVQLSGELADYNALTAVCNYFKISEVGGAEYVHDEDEIGVWKYFFAHKSTFDLSIQLFALTFLPILASRIGQYGRSVLEHGFFRHHDVLEETYVDRHPVLDVREEDDEDEDRYRYCVIL